MGPADRLIPSHLEARRRVQQRVSAVLHDQVGQLLTAVGFEVDLAAMDFGKDHPELEARLRAIQEHLEEAFGHVRSLAREMRTDPVERFGFDTALDILVETARPSWPGTLTRTGQAGKSLTGESGAAVLECARAALDNAMKHSGATAITVEAGSGYVRISDNGRGFSAPDAAPGLGLSLISWFTRQGLVESCISSPAGSGTMVELGGLRPDC